MAINKYWVFIVLGLLNTSVSRATNYYLSSQPQPCVAGETLNTATTMCECPMGYQRKGNPAECRPGLPTMDGPPPNNLPFPSDFFWNSNNFPVCGPQRLPVYVSSSSISSTDIISSGVPRSTKHVPGPGGFDFKYASGSVIPNYLYRNFNRCMCTWKDYAASPMIDSDGIQLLPVMNGTTPSDRFVPDTFEAISATAVNAISPASDYGPVAISKTDPAGTDGRKGTEFGITASTCGCPNVNEKMIATSTSDPNPVGAKCVPAVADTTYVNSGGVTVHLRKLVHYYKSAHSSLVMNASTEVRDPNGYVVDTIMVPSADGGSHVYQRNIWICDGAGYSLNVNTGNCEMVHAFHKVGPSVPGVSPATEVSPRATGMDKDEKYNNTVNKKFAACLNGFGLNADPNSSSAMTDTKFDCYSNDFINYHDFNQLWASTDTDDQGGQLNAIMLANAQGKPITGFYTLQGKHCDQFSEFAGALQPAIVNPKVINGIRTSVLDPNLVTPVGTPLPVPNSSGYTDLLAKIRGNSGSSPNLSVVNKRVPGLTSGGSPMSGAARADEMRDCPVLVRAAAVFTCPNNPPTATYQETDGAGNPVLRQCAAASEVKIHMKIQQLYEIKGKAKMADLDTVTSSNAASSVSVERIIAEKYGLACPKGMSRANSPTGACAY